MPRTCTICKHKKRKSIEKDLIKSDSFRTVSNRYKVSISALKRHKTNRHIEKRIVKSEAAKEVAEADDLQGHINKSLDNINFIGGLCRAHMEGDIKLRKKRTNSIANLSIRAETAAIKYYDLNARIEGKLRPGGTEPIVVEKAIIILPAKLSTEEWKKKHNQ